MGVEDFQKRLQEIRNKYGYNQTTPRSALKVQNKGTANPLTRYKHEISRDICRNIVDPQNREKIQPEGFKQIVSARHQNRSLYHFQQTPQKPLSWKKTDLKENMTPRESYAEEKWKKSIVNRSPIKKMKDDDKSTKKQQKIVESKVQGKYSMNIESIDKVRAKIQSALRIK